MPNTSEGIPDWFEHQIRGRTISFWFCKEIPSISCIVLLCHPKPSFLQDTDRNKLRVNLFVNGYEYTLSDYLWHVCSILKLRSENTFLFDLKLAENTNCYNLIHEKIRWISQYFNIKIRHSAEKAKISGRGSLWDKTCAAAAKLYGPIITDTNCTHSFFCCVRQWICSIHNMFLPFTIFLFVKLMSTPFYSQ